MKIKFSGERECCDPRQGDLKPYRGKGWEEPFHKNRKTVFCIHCGQIWAHEGFTDAAGGTDSRLVRVVLGNKTEPSE
jgi:hypothetical protein